MASTNNFPFRFLALPPELRDLIYREVLTSVYVVELNSAPFILRARVKGQIPPPHPASIRLAILQVSKTVYHEAKQVLYGLSTFRFKYPSTGMPLPGYQSKRSVANLMQNINVQLDQHLYLRMPGKVKEHLQFVTSMLKFFGGSSILRSTLVINIRLMGSSDFLLEASFLAALGKLTGFKTVVVTLRVQLYAEGVNPELKNSNYYRLDEYLKVMLGGGEAGKFDETGCYCLTYHLRGRAA